MTIPKLTANNTLTVKTLIPGTAAALTKTRCHGGELRRCTSGRHHLHAESQHLHQQPVGHRRHMLPGLETALIGQKVGSRVLAVVPPAQGLRHRRGLPARHHRHHHLVFVIDVLKSYPDTAAASGTQVSNGGGTLPTVTAQAGGAPTVTIPSNTPPTTLVTKTLIKGSGPQVAKGDYVIAQYTGYIWRTKKVFGSSWSCGSPFGFIIGASPAQVITGWDTGLARPTVGSRVMLVIPPKDGYGSSGQSPSGIKGTDTLVFVVDIIDAFKPARSRRTS